MLDRNTIGPAIATGNRQIYNLNPTHGYCFHLTKSFDGISADVEGVISQFCAPRESCCFPPRPIIEDPDSVQRIRVIYHPDKNENKGGIIALYD